MSSPIPFPTTNDAAAPAERTHAHHWVIEEPNGTHSQGRCKSCGEIKAFKNWLSETDFVTNEEYRALAAA